MTYGKIDPQHALNHFWHKQQRTYRKWNEPSQSTGIHIQGWANGKQISSLKEVIPTDRWIIHYTAHKDVVGSRYPTGSQILYLEHIFLIDNYGQPYEFTRDERDDRTSYPLTFTINHHAQIIMKDPQPLAPNLIDLYKKIDTPSAAALCEFTRAIQNAHIFDEYTAYRKRALEIVADLRAELETTKKALAASNAEKEALRAEIAKCKADLLALL